MLEGKLTKNITKGLGIVSMYALMSGAVSCLQINAENQKLSREIKYNRGYKIEIPADLVFPSSKDYWAFAKTTLGLLGVSGAAYALSKNK